MNSNLPPPQPRRKQHPAIAWIMAWGRNDLPPWQRALGLILAAMLVLIALTAARVLV